MSSPTVTVLRDRYVRAGELDGAEVMPLAEALTKRFGTDAHFQQAVGFGARVAARNFGHVPITINVVAFDIDGPDHEAPPEWRHAERVKLDALLAAHPGAFIYETRGGYRVVYRLAETYHVRNDADANAWTSDLYLPWCDMLAEFDIQADRSCSDPQRLFRLPLVVRTFGEPREAPLTFGNAAAVGTLSPPTTAARTLSVSGFGSASREHGVNVGVSGPSLGSRTFMLYKLLERRGDILETHGAGAFVVRCPRRARHSCGRDGDGSTLLFAPQGSGYGVLHCKHDSCADVSFSEWLAALDVNTGAPPANRIARIEGVGIDSGAAFGVRLVLTLAPADGRPLPMRYLRIYSSSPTRWEALWTATNVEAPDDLNPKGDLGAAAHELRGRRIKLELDTVAGDEVVRALHAPDPQ